MDHQAREVGVKGERPKIKAIQGLRAISVLSVIFFDAGFSWLPGGFIGVDIFFVLSGFMVTQMIVAEIHSSERFDFRRFYAKRIRRLVPTSILVVIACISVGRHLLPAERLRGLGWDSITSALYATNYRAYFSGMNYLQPGFSPSILTHYWALAVEGQIFLIWPVLILVGYRLRKSAGITVALTFALIGSFVYDYLTTPSHPALAYFSTFSRAWEFAIGAVTFLYLSHFNNVPERLDPLFAWGGIIVILYCTTYQSVEQYLSNTAPIPELLAVFGTVFILIGSYNGRFLFSFLISNPLLYGIGEISYCLYLWHWPIYFLMQRVLDRAPGGVLLFLYFILTFFFSIATFIFVERPIRNYNRLGLKPAYSFVWGGVATAIAIGAAIGLLGWNIHEMHFGSHRSPSIAPTPSIMNPT